MKIFLQKMPLLLKYLSKSDNKLWQNICIVMLIFRIVHFLDLGEFNIDMILFVTVA